MYALKLMPAVIAACSTWLRSSGGIRTDMTDVRGVPFFGALVVIGPARGDQGGAVVYRRRRQGVQGKRGSGLHVEFVFCLRVYVYKNTSRYAPVIPFIPIFPPFPFAASFHVSPT